MISRLSLVSTTLAHKQKHIGFLRSVWLVFDCTSAKYNGRPAGSAHWSVTCSLQAAADTRTPPKAQSYQVQTDSSLLLSTQFITAVRHIPEPTIELVNSDSARGAGERPRPSQQRALLFAPLRKNQLGLTPPNTSRTRPGPQHPKTQLPNSFRWFYTHRLTQKCV